MIYMKSLKFLKTNKHVLYNKLKSNFRINAIQCGKPREINWKTNLVALK